MFDFVQEKKRLVQIVLALIIVPFAFWGIDSFRRSGGGEAPATVDGAKITQQEFDNALRQQQNQMRQMLGANFDPAMLDKPEFRRAVMDNLVSQRLLAVRAKAAGLVVTDEQIAQIIRGIETFQANGNFDKKRYEAALAGQNMTPLMFEALLRDEVLGQELRDGYVQNGFVSNTVADNVIRLNEQQRVVSIYNIPFQQFVAQAKVGEAELKKYYDLNQKEFQSPEQARVEYVKLSVEGLAGKVEVSPDEVRQYYDSHQNDFGTLEQRQAAHILIAAAATAPQAEQDAAKAKAEQVLQQVKQNPGKFAELAKQYSQDPGSASSGGDLGVFGRGMMVKPFEDAAFALKPGEISGLVKSDFGYHIIKLIAIKPTRVLSFDEARESIANKLRLQKAADKFAELAEKFTEAVYTQSDTLKPAADLAGTKIEQSGWLIKGAPAAEPWTPKMLQAVFSDDVVKNKRNTAAIEVGGNTMVAARILEHKPAAARAFNEVREMINQKLQQQQALELAAKQGKTLLEQLQRGEKAEVSWAPAQTITRAQRANLDVGVARKVFQANAAKLPQYVGGEVPQGGYVLVRVEAVKDGDKPDDMKRARYLQQLHQMTGEAMFMAFLADARKQADIKVNLPANAPTQP
ncbi:MAG TPA: SurA N-terminal domain-containing protein [Gallionella sp.]|nr:SurA N-terminal domain-containing protein [Gallionella sp.]